MQFVEGKSLPTLFEDEYMRCDDCGKTLPEGDIRCRRCHSDNVVPYRHPGVDARPEPEYDKTPEYPIKQRSRALPNARYEAAEHVIGAVEFNGHEYEALLRYSGGSSGTGGDDPETFDITGFLVDGVRVSMNQVPASVVDQLYDLAERDSVNEAITGAYPTLCSRCAMSLNAQPMTGFTDRETPCDNCGYVSEVGIAKLPITEGDDPSPFNFCKNCGGKVKKSVASESEKWNQQGHCGKKCKEEWDSKHFGCCGKAKAVECDECDQAYECVEHGPTHLGYHKKTEGIRESNESKLRESSSRHCHFFPTSNGWYVELGNQEYADSYDSTTYGPFASYEAARGELEFHSNPGGSWVTDEIRPVPTASGDGGKVQPPSRGRSAWDRYARIL